MADEDARKMQHRARILRRRPTGEKQLSCRRFRACVLSLLLLPLLVGGCQRVQVSERRGKDVAAIDSLLRLMATRLSLMHDVAKQKWNARQPITDSKRERELLETLVSHGQSRGLVPEFVRRFFLAQFAAARLVQQADFARWKASHQQSFTETTSLAVLRRQIDEVSRQLIDALAAVYPWLTDRAVQQELSQRAEAILTGDGLDEVRATAIEPLRLSAGLPSASR